MTKDYTRTKPMKLTVHPGIGDISWVLSKLATTGLSFDLVIAEDSKTRRSMPLVDMVPFINSAVYGNYDTYSVLAKCGNAKFSDYLEAEKSGKELYITANTWLEKGNRLEGFLPDLNTDFHYPLYIPDEDDDWARRQVAETPRAIGVYTSSLAGIHAWRAWSLIEWVEFMSIIRHDYPDVVFFLIGAKWDQDTRRQLRELLSVEHLQYVDMLGKTSLPQVVALTKHLDYLAGYASGVTVMADVINQPTLMLYPRHLHKMMNTWPDPVNLATGVHQAHVWARPVDIYDKVAPYLSKYLANPRR